MDSQRKSRGTNALQAMRETQQQLQAFIIEDFIATNFETSASHVWSIDHGSCRCGECWLETGNTTCCDVNNCDFDLSGAFLRHIYPGKTIAPRLSPHPHLHWVDQRKYTSNITTNDGFMRWGIVYVPTNCTGNVSQCDVHVNYHGCTAKDLLQRRLWTLHLDLNAYAEANDIVVVYPQVAGDSSTGVGCWNWDAYSEDPLFDTQQGKQLVAVQRLLANLEAAVQGAVVLPDSQIPNPDTN